MEERERGAGRVADDERDDARSSRQDPATHADASSASAEEAEFRRQMGVGRRGMRRHRNVLAALAK